MFLFKTFVIVLISFMEFLMADSHRFGDLSKLVKNVIENERVPSILWAKTCWPKFDEFHFVKTIAIPIQIDKSTAPIGLLFNDNSNKQWFFIDMNCVHSSDFLMNTEEKYFAQPYRWIIADASNDSIASLSILPGSNVILANKDINSAKYILKQGTIYISYLFIDFFNRKCNVVFAYESLQNQQRRSIDL